MNQNPIITPDLGFTVLEDSGASIFNLTANDIDPDGGLIEILDIANPVGGTWERLQDGGAITSLVFTPALNFNGTASIDYRIIDGQGGSARGTFEVEVAPINDAPVIVPDPGAEVDQDSGPKTFNITANDFDIDGGRIEILDIANPVGGTWERLQDGGPVTSLVFTPDAGFTGTASVQYRIIDGQGGNATGVFEVEVLPVDPYAGFEQGTDGRDCLFGILFASNEIFGAGGNDKIFGGFRDDHLAGGEGRDKLFGWFGDDILDGNEGNDKLFGGVGDDLLNGGAGRDFLHGGRGLDTALYEGSVLDYGIDLGRHRWSTKKISDGTDTDRLRQVEQAQFDDALVFLDGRNNAVFAQDDDAGSTSENMPLTIAAADVLANDFDFDGDTILLADVSATSANGAAVTLANGEITYDPGAVFDALNDGETATDSFTYIVDDGRGGMATATVTVTVEGRDDGLPATATIDDTGFDLLA